MAIQHVIIPDGFDPILRTKAVITLLSISRSTLHGWVKKGIFPAPFQISPDGHAVGWRTSTVQNWINQRGAKPAI